MKHANLVYSIEVYKVMVHNDDLHELRAAIAGYIYHVLPRHDALKAEETIRLCLRYQFCDSSAEKQFEEYRHFVNNDPIAMAMLADLIFVYRQFVTARLIERN